MSPGRGSCPQGASLCEGLAVHPGTRVTLPGPTPSPGKSGVGPCPRAGCPVGWSGCRRAGGSGLDTARGCSCYDSQQVPATGRGGVRRGLWVVSEGGWQWPGGSGLRQTTPASPLRPAGPAPGPSAQLWPRPEAPSPPPWEDHPQLCETGTQEHRVGNPRPQAGRAPHTHSSPLARGCRGHPLPLWPPGPALGLMGGRAPPS